jgi:L-ribulokinase
VYSSEWFFSKVWHCLKVAPEVFDAAFSWAEISDWIPGFLTGNQAPLQMKRNVCANGHKAMFNADWGGLPSKEFLAGLDPKLGALKDRLFDTAHTVDQCAGHLTAEWASTLGLRAGIPVAVGALDAHMGAIGSGISAGAMVKILGTSSCDMAVAALDRELPDVPGLCGIVKGSILPGYYGLEAGQAAAGDLFNWWVNEIEAGGPDRGSHAALTAQAEKLQPGQSGLLALDWNNGNRCVLVDPRLTGLLVGQTLHTQPAEVYRALIESTAFGARAILDRFAEYGIRPAEIINAGGIAEKNPMVMQIYADITGLPLKISRSAQTCALGAAMCGAVAGGKEQGGFGSLAEAQAAMSGLKDVVFKPLPANQAVYGKIYRLYRELYDAFGTTSWQGNLFHVMKDLLTIRDEVRGRA